jgi:cleavage and polyadenylation specificity factor subunit 1
MRDEDELLYGNPDAADSDFKKQQSAITSRWWRRNRQRQQIIPPSHWLVIARDTGALEIYTLPDLQLRMGIVDIATTPRILGHTTQKQDFKHVGLVIFIYLIKLLRAFQ